ncbi:MAG: RDD family protein [Campylobacteraceae bacterium]|jgi:uncharacterized RDD family membrane protein YckC|nr:RDD family protein [Campylobacteraceae bacterium]
MTEEELIKKFESENITLSPLYKRAAAYIIDEIVITFFIFFAFSDVLQTADAQNNEALFMAVQYLAPYIILMKIIYQAFFVWMYGATVGKIAMKIRIISIIDGQKPTMLFSFVRANTRIISEAIFFIGFLWALQNFKKQTWEDITARTLVINA